MSNPSFAVDASSPFQCISSPTSPAASPSSSSTELFDVDESMSDIMSAVLQRSSSPDYSTTSEESGSFEEVEYDGSLAESIVSTVSTASTESTVSIESTVSTKEALDEDADNEQSSCDSYESSANGSPKIVYQGSLNFEGSISNETAEAEDGPNTEVDEVNTNVSASKSIIVAELERELTGYLEKIAFVLREDENVFVTTTSHMEEVINSPGEEHMLSERMGQTTQVDDTDIGSPMSIDFLTE
ncbi:hypothetical protein FRC09_001519 [Ceratobasidium sp. 395]|nr:hypothetical protein FRC09_001519 [Ceratobasidium sp. 395]